MKKFFYALFLLCLPLMAQAEFVSEADAEAIASEQRFFVMPPTKTSFMVSFIN